MNEHFPHTLREWEEFWADCVRDDNILRAIATLYWPRKKTRLQKMRAWITRQTTKEQMEPAMNAEEFRQYWAVLTGRPESQIYVPEHIRDESETGETDDE